MSIKFAFIGGTGRGYKLMNELLKNKYFPEFAFIIKEDDHEADRYSGKISKLLKDNNIDNSIKRKLNETDYERIKNSDLDFIIVFGWRTLIDTKVNQYMKFGLIASHHSLLPKYRGFAPVQWAIIHGETQTGATLFLIDAGEADSGRIISQKKIQISSEENAGELDDKLTECTIELVLEFFENYKNNKIRLTQQNESEATYTCKRTPEDGKINWGLTSAEVNNLIRALSYPAPGAFCYFNDTLYVIRKAEIGKDDNKYYSGRIPGRVIKTDENGIEVLCGNGTLLIKEWEENSSGKITCPAEKVKSLTATLK